METTNIETSKQYLEQYQKTELSGLLNITKSTMQQATDKLVLRVKDGYLDGIEALIYCKKGQELFKLLEAQVRPLAEDQAHLTKGEVYKKFDTEIIQKESGVKWDFSTCEDPEWNDLQSELESIKVKIDDREKFLKGITKKTEVLNDDEIITLYPPLKSGKLGLAVSIK